MDYRERTNPSAPTTRRHMGTATSDPTYLPPVTRGSGQGPTHPRSNQRAPLHYDRYLQSPKPGKSIFTARQDRSRRRILHRLIALLVLAGVIAAVWFFFLR